MNKKRIMLYSKLFNLFTILSIIFALFIVAFPPNEYATTTEGLYFALKKIWVFYLFISIAVGSIIFGVKNKKRGFKVKKNIVIGIIFTVILFGFGTMHFVGLLNYSTDYSYVLEIEQIVDFDFPDDGSIIKMDWTNGKQTSYDDNYYKFESVVRFSNQGQINQLEINLNTSGNWVKYFSADMQEIIPTTFTLITQSLDNYMLFAIEQTEYNNISEIGSEQNFIFIAYDADNNILQIYEFSRVY